MIAFWGVVPVVNEITLFSVHHHVPPSNPDASPMQMVKLQKCLASMVGPQIWPSLLMCCLLFREMFVQTACQAWGLCYLCGPCGHHCPVWWRCWWCWSRHDGRQHQNYQCGHHFPTLFFLSVWRTSECRCLQHSCPPVRENKYHAQQWKKALLHNADIP